MILATLLVVVLRSVAGVTWQAWIESDPSDNEDQAHPLKSSRPLPALQSVR